MTDEIPNLLSFANYTNYLPILGTIFSFILIVFVILRLNEENIFRNFGAVTRFEEKMEQPGYKLQNPFSIVLSPDSQHLDLSLKKSCLLYIYWGAVITEFFQEIQKPWLDILENLKAGEWLKDFTLLIEKGIQLSPEHHKQLLKKPPEVTGELLGSRPRSRYPAIVITVIDNISDLTSSSYPQIVAVFSVIHVQDTVCNSDTHIMYQYLKTTDDQVTTLQPLFVSQLQQSEVSQGGGNSIINDNNFDSHISASHDNAAQHSSIIENSDLDRQPLTEVLHNTGSNDNNVQINSAECVVCQTNDVTIAILPCRHACVCDTCLQQLDKCPMCRGYIVSYFRIGDEENFSSQDSSHRLSREGISHSRLDGESRWEYFNRRMNELLGFQ
ncbi:cell growth regulator with RING finger domain protein 1-like [Mytilus californianus]|uniref:cell growth regulator with RING finger domain protein 1-like n=1 Tax=Mytilus californianus TaxID=6549 RepID=UPI002247DECF|nr:cell growth regulator with RING finger domain protein 1-like [Mytilus californianus]